MLHPAGNFDWDTKTCPTPKCDNSMVPIMLQNSLQDHTETTSLPGFSPNPILFSSYVFHVSSQTLSINHLSQALLLGNSVQDNYCVDLLFLDFTFFFFHIKSSLQLTSKTQVFVLSQFHTQCSISAFYRFLFVVYLLA